MEENELPDGWVWTTLENVTLPTRMSVQPTNYPTLPFVGMEHVEAETMRLLGTTPAIELKSNALHFYSSDVLYGRLRPYLNKVLRADFEGLCSAEFLVFRETPNLQARYLQYFLNSWGFKEFASHLNEGDRPRVDWNQLKNFDFPLAPLPEQHRIVAAIEQQFTRLDAGVADLKSAKTRLKRYRAAVLKAAVEGKLTEAWRAEHPTSEPASQLLVHILQERRAKWEADLRAKGKDPTKVKYVEPSAPDVSGLAKLPEGWCWATVEQVGDVGTGATPLKGRSEYYKGGTIPWITSGALNDDVVLKSEEFITEKALRETNVKIFPIGSLLVAMYGEGKTRGKVSELKIEATTNQACAAIVFRSTSVTCQPYVKYFLLSNYFDIRRLSVGGVQPNLNLSIVKETCIPLPPLDEQQQIVSEVERRLSVVSQLEAMVEANLKRAERLRQSVFKEAFAGRLVPQDPDDEPASVLLERIQQEREVADNGNKGRKQSKQHRTDSNSHTALKQATPQEAYAGNRMAQEPEPLDESEIAQVALWNAD